MRFEATKKSPEKENNLKMLFSADGRRLLLSKQAAAPHSEKIATECPKLKFSMEKIIKGNLSKKIEAKGRREYAGRRKAKKRTLMSEARNNPSPATNIPPKQMFIVSVS